MSILLISHIIVALAGIAFATLAYFMPSTKKLWSANLFAASTLVSGTALLVLHPSHLLTSCLMGIAYFSFVSALIYQTHKKLSTLKVN
jgi:hypothetical protein